MKLAIFMPLDWSQYFHGQFHRPKNDVVLPFSLSIYTFTYAGAILYIIECHFKHFHIHSSFSFLS